MRKKAIVLFVPDFDCGKESADSGRGRVESEKHAADSVFRDGTEQEIYIQGQVYQKKHTSNMQVLYLKNNSIQNQKYSFYESQIMIYDKTFQPIAIGKTVTIKGKTACFDGAGNPGNFDQRQYYRRQGFYGFVWSEQILQVSGKTDFLRNRLCAWKEVWSGRLVDVLGEKNGNLMSAILLGEKGELDAEMKEVYQKSGIGHILAISGLHISFIGLGMYRLLRRAGCPYPAAGLGASIFLGLYVLMIGCSVSVLRASVMLIVRMGADVTGRVYDMATALFLSGAVTVLWQPLCIADAGFLLSYGAILGILVVLPMLEKLFFCRYKVIKGMYAGLAIHFMLFPIMLYFYFEFPTYSILLNVVVIPMMSAVMGFGLLGSALTWLCPAVGNGILRLCGCILTCFEAAGRMTGRLPASRIVFGQPEIWQMALYYMLLFAGVWVVLKCGKKKWYNLLRVNFLLYFVGMTSLFFIGNRISGSVQVTVLDVGQGDGIVIRGPENHAYLIDGGSSDEKKVGKYRLEPFLKSQGVGRLDYVFLSHGDIDHCSGVEEMIERQDMGVKIACLVLPAVYEKDAALCRLAALAKNNGIRTVVMERGNVVREGELAITCIQPERTDEELQGNAGSMVLDVAFGAFDMLCTGDVEERGEELLIRNISKKKYDVLKVAHHGSKNSTRKELLACVRPKTAVISSGKGNRYGHPHKETVERLEEYGCEIYDTQDGGAVRIESDGEQMWVEHDFTQ